MQWVKVKHKFLFFILQPLSVNDDDDFGGLCLFQPYLSHFEMKKGGNEGS